MRRFLRLKFVIFAHSGAALLRQQLTFAEILCTVYWFKKINKYMSVQFLQSLSPSEEAL